MTDSKREETLSFACDCRAEDIIFLPCSGGSNCGEIAYRVAVDLDIEKVGRISCLAGIAAHIDDMMESAKRAKRIVALDGCDIACAKKTIEHAGLTVTDWICVTNEGISKYHDFMMDLDEIELIAQRTRELLARPAKALS